MKKDSNKIPYEIWYGYKPNVSYFKVFGRKCYILKESRRGKFDVKGHEGINTKVKHKKCLNLSTYKIIDSAHVRIDKFSKKSEEERKKELEDYRRFVYYELDILPDLSNRHETSLLESPKSPTVIKF